MKQVKPTLVSGVRDTENIYLTFPEGLRAEINDACMEAWRNLNLASEHRNGRQFIPRHEWLKLPEGRAHDFIMHFFFSVGAEKPLPVSEINVMYARLQSQRRELRGRPRQFSSVYSKASAFRQFRSWWLSSQVAKALDLPFNEPCPYAQGKSDKDLTPELICDRFEEWTGRKLSKEIRAEVATLPWLQPQPQSQEQLAA